MNLIQRNVFTDGFDPLGWIKKRKAWWGWMSVNDLDLFAESLQNAGHCQVRFPKRRNRDEYGSLR